MAKVWFDEEMAQRYDEVSADSYRPEVLDPTVDLLHQLAEGGSALEFGIGTGRVAIPLSQRGVSVHGIDNSAPMLEQLRAKADAKNIESTLGDFAETSVDGSFDLVYLVFNTITNLTTQNEQVACFENAARHLSAGGCFVIEVFVPELRRIAPGERIRPVVASPTRFSFDEYTDFTDQLMYSHHAWVDEGSFQTFSAPFRYVWPGELDLMARLAGLRLFERWATWKKDPFTDESPSHVSVWQKS